MPSLYQSGGLTSSGDFDVEWRSPANTFNVDIATPAYFESPINALVGAQIKSGIVPLWNPYQGAGTPLLAQYSTRALFPLQILENISPVWTWDFFMLFRLLVAGFFTFLFLRSISLVFVPAFLGGVFYIFSGTFVWFINLEQMVNVAMMVPVLFFVLERLARKGGWGWVALSAVVLALTLLAGQPEIALYLVVTGYAYYIIRVFLNSKFPDHKRAFGRALFDISLVSLFGLALAAPLLLPFLELWANAHHIHQAGGPMGVQALPAWSRILPILTPSATEIAQDPSMVAGLCPLVPTLGYFFRYLPINGVWDSLGGYTGVLPWLLAISGLIACQRNSKAPWRMALYFFFAVAVAIILKNIGVRPFIWLGLLPLFDQVWSLRWAGPVWTFAMSVAGAIGFQMILPERAYSVSEDDIPLTVSTQMAPHPIRRKIDQYLQRKPYMPVVISFFIVLLFYFYTALMPTIMLVLKSGEIFNARMEPFVKPSIGGAVIVFFIILLYFVFFGVGISKSIGGVGKGRGRGYAVFIIIAALELWWAVPRGYSPLFLDLKWKLFLLGLPLVIAFYLRVTTFGVIFSIMFFGGMLYLDFNSPNGFPERSDPFEPPPYVDFIKAQEGHYRVAGSYGVLMPNFASSVGLYDVHYVNSLIPKVFHDYRTRYLHADLIREEPVSSLWFTGRPERCAVIGGEGKESGYQHHYRPVEDDFLSALKGYSLLGVKFFITPPDLSLGRVFPLIYDDKEVRIYRNPIVLERAWVVRDVRLAGNAREAQALVFEPDFYPSRSAVVEDGGVIERLNDIEEGGGRRESVEIVEYEATRVGIEVELDSAALLILSDTFYPGWKVSVNGKAAVPLRVDGTLRGVMLEEGKSSVVWNYRPMSFYAGVIISFGSIIICGFFSLFRRKREMSVEPGDGSA